MKLGILGLGVPLLSLLLGCASLPTLTERPEHYRLYRAMRVAPTQEERLSAAARYLREVPDGPRYTEVLRWFEKAEEEYYLHAFTRLPNLYAYQRALPQGPHIADVRARVALLEARRAARSQHEIEQDRRIAAAGARVVEADAARRAFVGVFKEWTSRLLKIESFGEPTSELGDETIFAFRLSEPRGVCAGELCRKLLQFEYDVPGDRELVRRAALLEVQLKLEAGVLREARLVGPELWTRLAEALSLKPLPTPSAEQRADAIQRSALLVRALLEPVLPAADCERKVEAPLLIERSCRGLRARMLVAPNAEQDDALEITAAP